MAANVVFKLNPTFERDVLARNPRLALVLETLAGRVEARAKDLAPKLTRHLEESITHEVGIAVVLGEPRLIGRVRADDFKAHWHEFGTRFMEAHPFLGPALQSVLPRARIGRGSST